MVFSKTEAVMRMRELRKFTIEKYLFPVVLSPQACFLLEENTFNIILRVQERLKPKT